MGALVISLNPLLMADNSQDLLTEQQILNAVFNSANLSLNVENV